MKPSFPFYPDDWMNDLGLRSCSPLSRSIWMDMLCLMHQGIPYGHLADASAPLSVKFVANRCGVTVKQFGNALCELEAHQVFSRTEAGVIFSRRMVRDEHNRIARGNGGHKAYLSSKEMSRGKPPFGPEEVFEKEKQKLEILKNPNSGTHFEEWWVLWSRVRGTNHRVPAERAYFQWVTEALEVACFECTKSYLASLDNPAKGYNPENFIVDQSQDGFKARWPTHSGTSKKGFVESVERVMRQRVLRGEEPLPA